MTVPRDSFRIPTPEPIICSDEVALVNMQLLDLDPTYQDGSFVGRLSSLLQSTCDDPVVLNSPSVESERFARDVT